MERGQRLGRLGLSGRPALAFGLAALSGLLVFAAFPPFNQSELAFIALIPFVWALRLAPENKGRLAYTAGLWQWMPGLWFLSPVTIPGALSLAAYCGLYWIPVGWIWGRFLKSWRADRPFIALRFVLGGSAWWCVCESLRGWLLTGFPWNYLGASQWENYSLIQLASLTGVPGLSFLLVSLNLGISLSVMGLFESMGKRQARRMHPELYLPILLLVLGFSWGGRELRRLYHQPGQTIRIGVIQPLAENKWSPELARENFRVLWQLSDAALSLQPDLLLWPETAVPEELRYSETASEMVKNLVKSGTPLLLGSLDFETKNDGDHVERIYYNSSFLIGTAGDIIGEYRKKHLVMFGEYMPFGNLFPFLRSLTPMPEDVTPGKAPGVMTLPGNGIKIGMLICFEDLMPELARTLVAEGADLFVNQSNDAWFDPLWGSQGHLANAVFRSVEQRRPMVRGTNSGVSAWIDSRGVVMDVIEDPLSGKRQIRGFKVFDIQVPEEPETTFYYQYPRAFIQLCLGVSLLLAVRKPDDV
jgi:apolipoprotein N-acyltransferase